MEKRKQSKLKKYNEIRDFSVTAEPKGKIKKTKAMRFVVQYHQARAKHYDFRLEYEGVLLSWAVPKGLSLNPNVKRLGVMVEDHPVDYIGFEGVIPKGNYGAGTVEIFDKGQYLPLEDMKKGLEKGHLKIVLNGEKLKGGWSLIKTNDNQWLFIKIKDEFSQVKTKKAENKLPFSSATVQLATLTNKIPVGKNWGFEIKYDGYRMLAFKENGKVSLKSRNEVDYTKKFNQIAEKLAKMEDNFVVDGEIVCFDENGRSDFGLLQDNLKSGKGEFYYVIFDLLAFNNEDLRPLPLKTRKEKLLRLLFDCDSHLIYSQHVEKGKESFEFAKKNNLEGIIAKNLSSCYSGARGEDWLKIKCYHRQEFVICGFLTSEKNEVLSALIVGYYNGRQLTYAGKVGTGFSEKAKEELVKEFNKIVQDKCPFKENLKFSNATWLKPSLVCEVQFAEFTKDNLLRQPSFLGLRKDKSARDIVLEKEK